MTVYSHFSKDTGSSAVSSVSDKNRLNPWDKSRHSSPMARYRGGQVGGGGVGGGGRWVVEGGL